MLVLFILVLLFGGISSKSLFETKCRLKSTNALNCQHVRGRTLTHVDGKVYHGVTILDLSGPTDKIYIDLAYFPDLEKITGGLVDCRSMFGGETSHLITLEHTQCYLSPSTYLKPTTDVFPPKQPSVFSTFTPVLSTFDLVLSTDLSTLSEITPTPLITAVLPTSITTPVLSITPTASLLIPTHPIVTSTIIHTFTLTTPSLPISLYSTNTISNVTNSSVSTLLIPTNSVTTSTIIPITSSIFPATTLISPSLAHPTPTIINDDIANSSTGIILDSHHSRRYDDKPDSVRTTQDKQYSQEDVQSDNRVDDDDDDDSVLVNTGLLATLLSLLLMTLMAVAVRLMYKHRGAWFSRWFTTHCHRRRRNRRSQRATVEAVTTSDDDVDADGAVDDDLEAVEMCDILATPTTPADHPADHPVPADHHAPTPAPALRTPADHSASAMSTPALRTTSSNTTNAANLRPPSAHAMFNIDTSLTDVEDYLTSKAEELSKSLDRKRQSTRIMMKKLRTPHCMQKSSFF